MTKQAVCISCARSHADSHNCGGRRCHPGHACNLHDPAVALQVVLAATVLSFVSHQ
jgi:hypothetical protein